MIPQFPHCDQRVLHAPGECKYCDEHEDWQELRKYWGIAFSGHDPIVEEHGWGGVMQLPCPSEIARDRDTINLWYGNRKQES